MEYLLDARDQGSVTLLDKNGDIFAWRGKQFEGSLRSETISPILKKAIIAGGSSIKNFSSSDGKKGGFQESFKVYGRKDKNCSNSDCSGKIVRAFLNNRSAFFCPKCQK